MAKANPFVARLRRVPTVTLPKKLVRKVPYVPLAAYSPPNWLFTSGQPRRYNLAGTPCLYMSEDEQTANVEYARPLPGMTGPDEPVVTYSASVQLQRVLDLTDPNTLKSLRLSKKDLYAPWRGKKTPTLTQLLGEAVAKHSNIVAIRFPSDAARDAGSTGVNVVIYHDRVATPDSVSILGPSGSVLQTWP